MYDHIQIRGLHMNLRRSIALLGSTVAIVAAAIIGFGGVATASPASAAPAAISLQQANTLMANAIRTDTFATPTTSQSPASPAFSCARLYVCGKGANGNSFAYSQCDVVYTLPDLTGTGPLINNQTSGTIAYFYYKDASYAFSSTAYDSRNVNWTPIWYAIAC